MNQNILSQSGHTAYGIKEFIIDTDDDIENLPIDIPMGSAALSIESGNVFILNSKDEWKNVGGGNGQSGGTSGPGISAVRINEEGHLIVTTTSGTTYDAGLAKGADGESFTFDELTEEQKAELKGEPFTFEDFTEEQLNNLKGEPFTYEDFTEQQLNNLKGKSAYEIALDNNFEGTEAEWIESLTGAPGTPGQNGNNGKSAYEIAQEHGYDQNETKWLESLKGEKGDIGDPFRIKKVYSSIEEMDADFENNDVAIGEFVIIASPQGAEDIDNAKLYVKASYTYVYIVDLSGATGIGIPGRDGNDGKSAYELAYTADPSIGSQSQWLASLKGDKGDSLTFNELTNEQKAALKGENGKSAYELAYAADSTIGTESQWLASLKGPKGDNYNLTNNDKADIADIAATIVRSQMEAAEGARF